MSGESRDRKARWARAAASCAVAILVPASTAFAQGCAMCYQSAAAASAPGREALRHGILVLLVPATSLTAAICVLIYRRRDPSASVPDQRSK